MNSTITFSFLTFWIDCSNIIYTNLNTIVNWDQERDIFITSISLLFRSVSVGLFEVSERIDEAHDDAYRHKTHSLTHQGPTSRHLCESRLMSCLVKFPPWTDACKRCLHKAHFPLTKAPRYFKGEKGNELLTCNRRLWRKLRSLGASRVPCHVSPCKAVKTPLKLQLPSLLWPPDGGGVCVLLDPLSLDSSPSLVKPADLGELTFTLYLAIYLSE